ncbi:MAG: lysophospholipid acyltransferase family protein [Candidatus Omnitrophica bacterium]|nr:lysophospholipid acyltransferase family protein [Candidatus Omnitrophota bacterium]
MKRFRHYIEYLILRLFIAPVNALPLRWAYRLGDAIGDIMYARAHARRFVAEKNIRAAFPEKSESEVAQIARACFRNAATLSIEAARLHKLAPRIEKWIDIEGEDVVWRGLEEKRGVIILTSHLGNWEIMANRAAAAGYPIHALARPLKNAYIYDRVKRVRGSRGLKSIDKSGAVRSTIKLLRKNQVVAMLVDQRETQGGIEIDFFNRKALTGTFAAFLAINYKPELVFAHFLRSREDRAKWRMRFTPLDIGPLSGDYDRDVRRITQTIMSTFESWIRDYPEGWYWMHERWRLEGAPKTRDLEDSPHAS